MHNLCNEKISKVSNFVAWNKLVYSIACFAFFRFTNLLLCWLTKLMVIVVMINHCWTALMNTVKHQTRHHHWTSFWLDLPTRNLNKFTYHLYHCNQKNHQWYYHLSTMLMKALVYLGMTGSDRGKERKEKEKM